MTMELGQSDTDRSDGCDLSIPAEMIARAEEASQYLKALAHEGRLMILCHLSSGEKSVTELEELLDTRQAAVSQQLARLRAENLVTCRRDGKAMFYTLSDPRAARLIGVVYDMFCTIPAPRPAAVG